VTHDELLALPVVVPLWPDAADALGIGRTSIYDLARRGELPVRVLRLGNQWRVPAAELRRVLGVEEPPSVPAAPDRTEAADDLSAAKQEGHPHDATG
jgi:excisionase family DNA binding protein